MKINFADLTKKQRSRLLISARNTIERTKKNENRGIAYSEILFSKSMIKELLSSAPIHMNENGLHRLDGPAVDTSLVVGYGTVFPKVQHWTFGELHRTDGYAIFRSYVVHSLCLDEEKFKKITTGHDQVSIAVAILGEMQKQDLALRWKPAYDHALIHIRRTLRHLGLSREAIQTIESVHAAAELLKRPSHV